LQAAIQAFESTLRDNVLVANLSFGSQEGMESVDLGQKTIRVAIA